MTTEKTESELGTPLKAEGPEWDTVEQERDYWKKLALAYGAKITAMRHTMERSWTVELDHQGNAFVVEDGVMPVQPINLPADTE